MTPYGLQGAMRVALGKNAFLMAIFIFQLFIFLVATLASCSVLRIVMDIVIHIALSCAGSC
ncbi:MAG: hypothetical protein LBB31_03075, partial [Prevotellaceae bacterium]|nr:hypothetical protein [Prevotellaceae bacterium]